MSVYKEGFHAVALIQQNSKQIYPDACDYGALVKKGDSIWNWAKQLVDWYGEKETRKFHRYSTGHSISEEVSLLNEHGGRKEIRYRVEYISVDGKGPTSGFNGYINVQKL